MREDYKTIMILGGIFAGFKKVGLTLSSCNPCPSLPSVATEDRKQIISMPEYSLKNKTGPLFVKFN